MRAAGIESFWDAAYRRGDDLEHWEAGQPPAELAAAVACGLVAPGSTVVDIGCGAGTEALFLASRGMRVVGVDGSGAALEIARRRSEEAGLAVEWHLGSAFDLPLADGEADFALDRGCLHVIARRHRRRYAREVRRVLGAGAGLLLRAARKDDEEAGLVGVDAEELEDVFAPAGLVAGPLVPLTLSAPGGDLAACLVLLRAE